MVSAGTTRIAVIGCGHWGKNIVRNFNELGVLAFVCEATETGRTRAQKLAPTARIVDRCDQLWASNIEGVVIATPADSHYTLAKAALQAGKDVLIEKPLALTCSHGAELIQLAEQQNRILMVGHVLEYHPGIERLTSIVNEGEIGTVRYICSNRLSLGKIRRENNVLWSFAPHDVAIILRLMGTMPFQVSACGGSYVQANIADVTVTHLLFDNGVRAHIYVSWLHPFKEHRLVVIGSRKMISLDDVAKKLVIHDQHVAIQDGEPVPMKGQGQEIAFASDEPLRRECEAFLEAIRSRQNPLTDGLSGLHVLKVLQLAQRSLMTNGAPVALATEAYNMPSTAML